MGVSGIHIAQIIYQGPKGEKGDPGAAGGLQQADLDTAIDAIINGAPAPLDSFGEVAEALDDKVDKEAGKVLSEEDFTTALKAKLDSLTPGVGGVLSKVYYETVGDEEFIPVTGIHLASVTDVRTNTSTLKETLGIPGDGQYQVATNRINLGTPAGAGDTYTTLMFT